MRNKTSVYDVEEAVNWVSDFQYKVNIIFNDKLEIPINLKKFNVTDCLLQVEFMQNVDQYLDFLNEHLIDNAEYVNCGLKYGLRSRIKLKKSSYKKLQIYSWREKEFGKAPVIKCLNDLVGFRLIIHDLDLNKIFQMLNKKLNETAISRFYERNDGMPSGKRAI